MRKGRPPTREKKLKDGFYIELRNRGDSSGVKIWRATEEDMMATAKDFSKTKEVIILGESKNGKWVGKPKPYK